MTIKDKEKSFTSWLKLHSIKGKREEYCCELCNKRNIFLWNVPDCEYNTGWCYNCMKKAYNTLKENGNLEKDVEALTHGYY